MHIICVHACMHTHTHTHRTTTPRGRFWYITNLAETKNTSKEIVWPARNQLAICELYMEFPVPQAWNNFVNSSEEDQQRILQMRKCDASLTSIQEESDEGEDENGNLDDSWEKVPAPSCDKRASEFGYVLHITWL